jgi:fucose permease
LEALIYWQGVHMTFQSPTAVTISGAFVVGMLLVLFTSIRLLLAKRLDISESRADWLVSSLSLALIPAMLMAGICAGLFGAEGVLLIGSLVTTAGLLILAFAGNYPTALGAVLLSGAGCAFLSTGTSVLMLKAFFPDNELASQNLGNVFFGFGALAAPPVAGVLIQRLGYSRALSSLAFIALLPALLAAFTQRAAFADLRDQSPDLAAVIRHPVFWLVSLAFLLYGPLEGSLGAWATRYLGSFGFREHLALWLLAGFWLSFLAARLGTALLATSLQNRGPLKASLQAGFIVVLALAAGVALGNMAGARTRFTAALGLLLVGAFFGPIFPTLVSILFGTLSNERGPAFGAMFSIGASGNLLLPPLIGLYARRKSLQAAMRVPMVTALMLALVTLVLALYPLVG